MRPAPSISTATPTGSSCTAPERRPPAGRRLRCAAVDERTYGVAELGSVSPGPSTRCSRPVLGDGPDPQPHPQRRRPRLLRAGRAGPLGAAPDAVVPVTLLASDRPTVNAVTRRPGPAAWTTAWRSGSPGDSLVAPRGRLQLRMVTIDPAYTLGRLGRRPGARCWPPSPPSGCSTATGRLPCRPCPCASASSRAWAAPPTPTSSTSWSGRHRVTVSRPTPARRASTPGESVAAAIGRLAGHGVDVVALVRGGGARTDLAPFDSEVIARAIALCHGAGRHRHRPRGRPEHRRRGRPHLVQDADRLRRRTGADHARPPSIGTEALWTAIAAAAAARLVAAEDRVAERRGPPRALERGRARRR